MLPAKAWFLLTMNESACNQMIDMSIKPRIETPVQKAEDVEEMNPG
jgi:hypothetical protein